QREKPPRRSKCAKKNGPSKFRHRSRDCLLMRFAIGSRLVIASDGKNCEIDTKADENGTKADANHAESAEKKLARSERHQTRQKKAKRHSYQRQPSSKPGEKNRAHEHD